MPKPQLVAAAPAAQTRTQARRTLAAAIQRRADADAIMREAVTSLTAVSRLVNVETTARANLDNANRRAAEDITAWAKNGGDGEPDAVDSVMLATLNHDLAMATATATAARAAMPDLQAKVSTARDTVSAARSAVDEAVRAVLTEEANAIDAEVVALFGRVTSLRTRLYGLGSHVERMPGANALLNTVRRLFERFVEEPTNAAVVADQDRWRNFAERLSTDADATNQRE